MDATEISWHFTKALFSISKHRFELTRLGQGALPYNNCGWLTYCVDIFVCVSTDKTNLYRVLCFFARFRRKSKINTFRMIFLGLSLNWNFESESNFEKKEAIPLNSFVIGLRSTAVSRSFFPAKIELLRTSIQCFEIFIIHFSDIVLPFFYISSKYRYFWIEFCVISMELSCLKAICWFCYLLAISIKKNRTNFHI